MYRQRKAFVVTVIGPTINMSALKRKICQPKRNRGLNRWVFQLCRDRESAGHILGRWNLASCVPDRIDKKGYYWGFPPFVQVFFLFRLHTYLYLVNTFLEPSVFTYNTKDSCIRNLTDVGVAGLPTGLWNDMTVVHASSSLNNATYFFY